MKITGLLSLHKPDKKNNDRNSDLIDLSRKRSDFSNLKYYISKFSKGAKEFGILHKDEFLISSLEMVKLFKKIGKNRIVEESLLFNYRLLLELFFDRENYKPIMNNYSFYNGMPPLESVFDYIQNEEKEKLEDLFDTTATTIYRWKKSKSKPSTKSLFKIKKNLEDKLVGDKEEIRKKINTYILLIHLSLWGSVLEKSLNESSDKEFKKIKKKILTVILYFSVKEDKKYIPAKFELRESFRDKDLVLSLHKNLISSVINMMEFPVCFLYNEKQQIVDAVTIDVSLKRLIKKGGGKNE